MVRSDERCVMATADSNDNGSRGQAAVSPYSRRVLNRPPARPLPGATEATGGERTRRRILELAIRRFGEAGYRDTSLAAIAREVGISAAAIHPYFRSKRELYLAAADAEIAAAAGAARAATAGRALPWLRLLQHVVDHVDEHPLLRRLLGGEPEDLVADVLELPALRAFGDEFATQLVDAQRAGLVRADIDARVTALGIETLALAMLGTVARHSTALRPDRQQAVASVLVAALLPLGGARAPTSTAGREPPRRGRRSTAPAD